MSLHLPGRRLVQTARSLTARPSPSLHLKNLLPQSQCRQASIFNRFGWGKKKKADPLAEAVEKQEVDAKKYYERLNKRTAGDSIFDEEIKSSEAEKGEGETGMPMAGYGFSNAREHKMRALDPDPRWRVKWQRRRIMQMVRNTGKPLSKDQQNRLVEREHHDHSDNLQTSVKKLVHLAHQLAGKTVDEAITQMKYSKKKMGKELVYVLNEARDNAIVTRGMALGAVNGEVLDKPKKIQTKDGRWIEVQDPTRLYIDQAWVGKGPWRGVRVQYHSRGRQSLMWKPTTRMYVVLKEEKTRIRLHEEKLEKQAKKKPWVHLPNRPVTAQRQYYSW
ncbi:ribosomal protein L22/L17 [Pseudomassariella vexata]|uniref:Ribosomal protein L22/L17 n=1 Tax=Pseudomassariella vexata TaxID=1141098 RepID=A0A1Y2DAU0_9PEZI|nr:ribosomal protein L22/L17 [Pseudomassariella vexata]ORY56391.1 ribosomal protein L22/L17 [Pseudomassariella vexata]